jgi:hypothetical protein
MANGAIDWSLPGVKAKIAKLIEEGRKPKQAAAIAADMQRRGELGPKGGKKEGPGARLAALSRMKR